MKLVKQYATTLSDEGTLKNIEIAARNCYKSEDKITEDHSSAIKIVNNLVKRKHYAMLEFGKDIKISLTDSEASWFFLNFSPLPLFKGLEFYNTVMHDGIVVIINPRTVLEIIEYLEIVEDKDHWRDNEKILYNTLVLYTGHNSIINNRKLIDDCKFFPLYKGSIGNKEKITVRIVTNRGVTHELVRHKFCVAI